MGISGTGELVAAGIGVAGFSVQAVRIDTARKVNIFRNSGLFFECPDMHASIWRFKNKNPVMLQTDRMGLQSATRDHLLVMRSRAVSPAILGKPAFFVLKYMPLLQDAQ
jgi:hypothetical protein